MRMRSNAVLALFLAVLVSPAALDAQGIRLGPTIGLNSATLGGDDAEGVDSRISWLLGGFVNFDLSPNFALQPELLYSRKGAKLDFDGDQATLAVDYIEIPVLAQIRFPSQGVTPYFLVGPALSFKSGCEAQVESGGTEVSVDCSEIDVNLKDTDFSLIGGVGIEVRNFTASLRYDYGLSRVIDDAGDIDVFNRTITLAVGYAFHLGR